MSDFFATDTFLKINRPLAYKLRPKTLDNFKGQLHLLSQDKVLTKIIKTKNLVNMIFYGPSGCGKTTLVQIISNITDLPVSKINATISGISEIKDVLAKAKQANECHGKNMLVMIDEIHRFNKTQQDALLPAMEDGSIILIGLTTENPYYYVNNALLSRSMVFEFKKLTKKDIYEILSQALTKENYKDKFDDEILNFVADFVDGDARYALNIIEMIIKTVAPPFTLKKVKDVFGEKLKANVKYDKKQDYHYDVISAFIKSMRGSDPDATLYWLAIMLHAGEDPRFIARRIAIAASEDVGMAAPNVINIANSAWNLVEKVGMPEARIILAEAAVTVATAPKSNSVYLGIDKALADIENGNIKEVPNHLKDSSRDKALGHGKGYKYPHDFANHFIKQDYFDNGYKEKYYNPSEEGREKIYKEYLRKLWEL